jgi:hypothetical protein
LVQLVVLVYEQTTDGTDNRQFRLHMEKTTDRRPKIDQELASAAVTLADTRCVS